LSTRYSGKFLWLKHKNNTNLFKKIKPIRYSYIIKGSDCNDTNNIKFIISDNTTKSDLPRIGVNIKLPNQINL